MVCAVGSRRIAQPVIAHPSANAPNRQKPRRQRIKPDGLGQRRRVTSAEDSGSVFISSPKRSGATRPEKFGVGCPGGAHRRKLTGWRSAVQPEPTEARVRRLTGSQAMEPARGGTDLKEPRPAPGLRPMPPRRPNRAACSYWRPRRHPPPSGPGRGDSGNTGTANPGRRRARFGRDPGK